MYPMTAQEYLEHRLQTCSQYSLTEYEKQLASENLKDFLFTQLTRKNLDAGNYLTSHVNVLLACSNIVSQKNYRYLFVFDLAATSYGECRRLQGWTGQSFLL